MIYFSDETSQQKAMHSAFSAKSPAPLLFTHSDLQRNTQQFVDDINAKRKRDTDSIAGYFWKLGLGALPTRV